MAKSGTRSTPVGEGGRSSATRKQLIDAAVATLQEEGFVGASARAIATRAGVNQGLIFYHFGSVSDLLLAALDTVSAERLAHYGEAVAAAGSPVELVDAATDIFRTDLEAGYLRVLVAMLAGATSDPDLGPRVAERLRPWRAFAEEALVGALPGSPLAGLLPAADAAHAVVALYLGLEMLSHLDGDQQPALALFGAARRVAELMGGPARADANGTGGTATTGATA